jgi:type IV pilus assembly protein PilV
MNIRKQSGVTLIEVLVTLFVMSIGMLGLAGLQSTTVKDGLDTAKRSQIMWLVSELVERMRANPAGQATGYTAVSGTSCSGWAPNKQCAANGAGDANTTCSANDMAEFDVWEVFCGRSETNVMANSVDAFELDSFSISCSGGGTCGDRSNFTVSISWTSQAIDDARLLSDTAKADQNTQTIEMVVIP